MNIGIARSNHFIQLSYIYSIVIVFTCYYALDSAIIIEGNIFDGNITASCEADLAATYAGNGFHSSQVFSQVQACFINFKIFFAVFQLNVNLLIGDGNTLTFSQSYACNLLLHILYVGYRFIIACINVSYICIFGSYAGQTCQIFLQLYLYIFASIAYFDVVIAAEVNNFAGCYIYSFTFADRKFPTLIGSFFYSIQLAAVYCVFRTFSNCAICYAGNLLAVCVQTAAGDVCLIVITNTSSRHIEVASCYAVYSQSLLQFQTICSNLKVLFIFLQLHRNCISFILINSNTITSSIFSICINRRKVYIYTIIIFAGYCQSFTT